jgi:hypothetical protein
METQVEKKKKKSKTTASPLSCLRSRRLAWFSDILHTPNWVAPAHNPDTRCSSSRELSVMLLAQKLISEKDCRRQLTTS